MAEQVGTDYAMCYVLAFCMQHTPYMFVVVPTS